MERSCTQPYSRSEIIDLMLSRMSRIVYKIYYFVMIIIAIFHMPLQHKFQMLSELKQKVIGKKVI